MDGIVMYNINKLLANIEDISSNINNDCCDENLERYTVFQIISEYNNDFTIKYITQGIKQLGYSTDKIFSENKKLSDIMTESEFEYFKTVLEKHIKDNTNDFICQLNIYDSENNIRNVIIHINIYKSEKSYIIECFFVDTTNYNSRKSDLKRIASIIYSEDMLIMQHKLNQNSKPILSYVSENISYYGFSKKNLMSNPDDLLVHLNSHDTEVFKQKLRKAIEKKSHFFVSAFRLISFDGETFWIFVQTTIYYNNGEAEYIESIVHNLNSEKQRIGKLQENQIILENNLKHTQLISNILKFMHTTNDYKASLKNIMQQLSNFVNVSYIRILIPYSNNKNYIVYTYNLTNDIFKQKIISNEHLITNFPNIIKRLDKFGTAYRDSFGASKDCHNEFISYGDFAYIVYSIKFVNDMNGYIILSDKDNSRTWDSEIISIITDISQIISSLFNKYLTQLELSTTLDTFKTVLNNIDSYVCVSTIESDEIIFSNKKFNDNFNNESNNKHLWECMGIEKQDYNYILNKNYQPDTDTKPHFCEIFSPATNQWIDISQMNLIWVDGRIVKLSTLNNITQKVEYEKLIETQALNDHLTGLPNRRMLEKDFQMLTDEALQENSFGYILFLDLDNFKNVNDGLGHQYGDILLQNVSEFLKTVSYTENYAYRFGGDEFVLLIQPKHSEKVEEIIETLLKKFQQKWHIVDTTYYCTMSMGVAKFPYDGTTLNDILKKVDMAMYNAKKQGKNRALHYKSKIGFDSIRSIELERYLRESISNSCSGFYVYYQPIINTFSKQIEGAEALLRWSCENLGNISPNEFIPLAENLGFIIQLGDFVLKEACIQCKKMIDMGLPDFRISINISVCQLFESDFYDKIKTLIEGIGVPYSNIVFEVTESLAINDFKKIKSILKKISELGIDISLDDFGTGYSSLNNIKEMPLNTIKIDKSFIDDLVNDSSTEVFVKTIITLAHALDMKVCAEGVEEEIQFNRLRDLNTDLIQGYYFGRPISANEFEEKYNLV